MKGKKALAAHGVVSFAASAVFLGTALFVHSRFKDPGGIINAVVVGLILALTAFLSFAAIHIFNCGSKSVRAELPELFCGFTAIILALLFVLGAVGQIVYSIGTKTYDVQVGEDEIRETVEFGENANIILMLDRSDSLDDINKKVEAACNSFLDGISEECNMGGGSFATDNNFINIRKMDQDGKGELKQAIECKDVDIGKQTNLADAFEKALNELKNSSPEKHKAIVIFTDGFLGGYDEYDEETEKDDPQAIAVYEKYKKVYKDIVDQGIEVYSIRPDPSFYGERIYIGWSGSRRVFVECSENFLRCVQDSGGKDYSVIPNEETGEEEQKAAIKEILDLLNEITTRTEEKVTAVPIYEERTDIVFSKGLILYDYHDEQTPYRIIVRLCFFVVYAILVQLLFFRRLSVGQTALSIGAAVLAWLSVCVGSATRVGIFAVIGSALFMFTLFACGKKNDHPQDGSGTDHFHL